MIIDKKPIKTPLTPIKSSLFDAYQVKVWIKRDDLNHPTVQGNKWHKLKNNLLQAKNQDKNTIITFGGAYSNHIAASAAAAKSEGFQSIGIIRGDELENQPEKWSDTLKTAFDNGMQFHFVSRQVYRQKEDAIFLSSLQNQYPSAFIIPEGGTNQYAVLGFKDLINDLNEQCPEWTQVYCAVGTGGTLAGLIHFSQISQTENNSLNSVSLKKIIGVPVLKQGEYLAPQIQKLLQQVEYIQDKKNHSKINSSWKLLTQYHDGGYAKQSIEGKDFQQSFEQEFSILLDSVYTSKMVYAFFDQLKTGKIPKGSNVILLHTGGLQGRK